MTSDLIVLPEPSIDCDLILFAALETISIGTFRLSIPFKRLLYLSSAGRLDRLAAAGCGSVPSMLASASRLNSDCFQNLCMQVCHVSLTAGVMRHKHCIHLSSTVTLFKLPVRKLDKLVNVYSHAPLAGCNGMVDSH